MELRAHSADLHVASPFVIAGPRAIAASRGLAALSWRLRRSRLLRRTAHRLGIPVGRVRVVRVELRAEGRVGYGEAKPLARYGESVDSALAFLADLAPRVADAAVLLVAQRVSTIAHADQSLVLEDGHAVGLGSHRELLATCETYREIVESQMTAEEAA